MKKLFLSLIISLVLLFLAGYVYLITFDTSSYLPTVRRYVRDVFGENVQINGRFYMTKSLSPIVTLTDIKIPQPEGFGQGDMLTIKNLEFQIDVIPLITDGHVRIHTMILSDVQLNLVRNEGGEFNWAVGMKGRALDLKNLASKNWEELMVVKAFSRNLDFTFKNGQDEKIKLKFDTAILDYFANFSLNYYYVGKKVSTTGSLKNLTNFLKSGRNLTFESKTDFTGDKIDFSGNYVDKDNMILNLKVNGQNFKKFIDELDIKSKIDLPTNKFDFIGVFKKTKGKVSFSNRLNFDKDKASILFEGDSLGEKIFDKIQSNLTLDVKDVEILKPYYLKPFNFTAKFEKNMRDLKFTDVYYFAGESDLKSQIELLYKGDVPILKYQIEAQYLDIQNMVDLSFLSNINYMDFLEKNQLRIVGTSKIDALKNPYNKNFISLYTTTQKVPNQLVVKMLPGTSVMNSPILGDLEIITDKNNVSGELTLKFTDIPVGAFTCLNKYMEQGLIDGSIQLSVENAPVADLLDKISGKIVMNIDDVELSATKLKKIDFEEKKSENTSMIDYYSYQKLPINVQQILLNLLIKDGQVVISDKTGVDTNKMYTSFTGDYDIKARKIDIQARPVFVNYKGEKVSKKENVLSIKGTFEKPEYQIDVDGDLRSVSAEVEDMDKIESLWMYISEAVHAN